MSTPINQLRRGINTSNPMKQQSAQSMPFNPMQQQSQQQFIQNPQQQAIPFNPMQLNNQQNQQTQDENLNNTPQNENQLVDDILREMNGNPGDSNINGGSYQYATDQSQIPNEKYPNSNEMILEDKIIEDEYKNFVHNEKRMISHIIDIKTYPWIINFINGLIVFLVLLFVSMSQVNKLIFTLLPGLLLESGQVSFKGIILKCVIGIILYIVLTTFII